MGQAGNAPYVDLDKALDAEDLPHAWMGAHESRGGVKLSQALRLTMLIATRRSRSYPSAVRKFMVRFISEEAPTPEQIRKVAHALEELEGMTHIHVRGEGPEWALKDLVRQLEERERDRLHELRA